MISDRNLCYEYVLIVKRPIANDKAGCPSHNELDVQAIMNWIMNCHVQILQTPSD